MGVTGVGGIFLRANDPKALSAWYATHLGIGDGQWGMWEQEAGTTVFSPFARDSDHFPIDRQVMLNYRVVGLDDLLGKLRAAGIDVITKAEWNDPATGSFARIYDPEGNPIELWEAPAVESDAPAA
ncbi:VOC domain-containing protein [Sphingomonas antarctica]|uniref:VOC family protein n=1 Tax=Sphingomonas antarctica TaxID=2040274 RepID=UPI0039E9173F